MILIVHIFMNVNKLCLNHTTYFIILIVCHRTPADQVGLDFMDENEFYFIL